VPGIEVTDDPLMQARLFSYLDTQLTRLGGPNFAQLPINCPHIPVNDMQRDGMHQTIVHEGLAPYQPNTVDGGLPRVASENDGGFVHVPRPVGGEKVRQAPASFADHFSQAALFWASLSDVEQEHVADAFTFELGKCYETPVRERMLANLAQVDGDLCARVAGGLGLPVPSPVKPVGAIPSPALQQVTGERGPIVGRIVGVVVGPDSDLAGIASLRRAATAKGAVVRIVAEVGGTIGGGQTKEIVERTFLTTRSIEYDAVLIAGGAGDIDDEKLRVLLQEAYRHFKVLGAWGDGIEVLRRAGIRGDAPGVFVSDEAAPTYFKSILNGMALHRFWGRALQ
jgi:catalase